MSLRRNIILTGFMGTGKSTVGKILAARLGSPFVDTDMLIEHEAGTSIARLFADKGERTFREWERRVIGRVCREAGSVIATGGGALVDEENARHLKASGTVICLTARPEVILARVKETTDRPLLHTNDPDAQLQRIRDLLGVRAEAYAKADMAIDTSDRTADEVVAVVLATLGKES